MTLRLKAILAAFLGLLASLLWWRRRASIERDARVQAELDRDVARGRAEVAEATVAVVAEVEARKDAAVEVGEDYKAEVAALATAAHAATPPAGVPVTRDPSPAEVIAAADEARRNARTRAKIAAGRKGRP